MKKRSANRSPYPVTSPGFNKRATLDRVEALFADQNAEEAMVLLEPLYERYPRDSEVLYYLGSATMMLGDLWTALGHLRKSFQISRHEEVNIPLFIIYISLGMPALGLQAYRRFLKDTQGETIPELEAEFQNFEHEIQEHANQLNLSVRKTEEGLQWVEEAQIALHDEEYSKCIRHNRNAIRILKDFLPPQNNLSMALFFNGQYEEACRVAANVLDHDPDNIHALSNLIRFNTLGGNPEAARSYWEKLKNLEAEKIEDTLKIVESAAVLEEDEEVYKRLTDSEFKKRSEDLYGDHHELLLALAEANLGKKRSAKKRLKQLKDFYPLANAAFDALELDQDGVGWTNRFPYFHITDMLPLRELDHIIQLMGRWEEKKTQKNRREIDRFMKRFPHMVLIGKKLIYEEQQVTVGALWLTAIDTPAAYDVLLAFGTSQTGSFDDRMEALMALFQAGQIQENETIRVWHNGEWEEIELQLYEVGKDMPEYSEEVLSLLRNGLEALHADQYSEAEKYFLRALALEPEAKDIMNNLGTAYLYQDKEAEARKMFNKAINIDPNYVMPRCNLALLELDNDDVEAATALIEPLESVREIDIDELSILNFVRAQIAIREGELDQAISYLKFISEINPEYQPTEELLDRLLQLREISSGMGSMFKRIHENNLRKREKQQTMLTTQSPTLRSTLEIYTKDILTGVGRAVLTTGGWSALRKAPLIQHIESELQDLAVLKHAYGNLTDDEKTALHDVNQSGGWIDWQTFQQKYDDDLDESPYWNWHEPETMMGRLRRSAFLVEATVDGRLILAIPLELRPLLAQIKQAEA